jgi:hypothetical protein
MGQAKQRKTEIDELKAAGPKSSKLDIVDFMYKLGDGAWADNMRSQIADQIVDQICQNLPRLVQNQMAGKTTLANGIKVGFDPNEMIDLDDYHICLDSPNFFQTILEFQQARKANPTGNVMDLAMVGCSDTKTISASVVYQGSKCNIVFTKWQNGAIVRFIPNNITHKNTMTGDAERDVKNIKDFVTGMKEAAE